MHFLTILHRRPSYLASLAFRHYFFLFFWPRFQNWDLGIRHLGGNFTEDPIFKSEIANSGIQGPTNRKIHSSFFIYVFKLYFVARRKASTDSIVYTFSCYTTPPHASPGPARTPSSGEMKQISRQPGGFWIAWSAPGLFMTVQVRSLVRAVMRPCS